MFFVSEELLLKPETLESEGRYRWRKCQRSEAIDGTITPKVLVSCKLLSSLSITKNEQFNVLFMSPQNSYNGVIRYVHIKCTDVKQNISYKSGNMKYRLLGEKSARD